ncbi:ParB/RepB/Spo0J family partition protein [Aminobacter sp. MSH1]|uniref:ParB/RepB/Spo0J family partition protein n=1 Tax=Aminobacter sp. MSH1 TaxID=374606 RepID=UPI00131F1602|nr:ParB/RepB/Spo0J family partition protein [Aminobacter sp. MSH1]
MNSNDKPTMIPFSQLVRTDHNARRTNKSANIEALAASIAGMGVLQNLVVSQADDGTYPVHAGDRRYQAIAFLIEQGKRPADFKVPCKIIATGNATAASLAENTMREQMHPADEFDAFVQLTSEGFTIDHIADTFGVTPLVVERRLKLTKAAPELLAEFRENNMSTDQLLALCSTDDHEKQVRIWEAHGDMHWANSPKALRRMVLQSEIDVSTDKRIPFIGGLQVYVDAGGEVRRDLFGGDGSGGFITNPVLLDELVVEKIKSEAARYEAAGWGFVEVHGEMDDSQLHRMGRLDPMSAVLPDDVAALVSAKRAEAAKLREDAEAMFTDDHDELDEDESEAYDDKNDKADALDDEANELAIINADYPAELKAKAGVILGYANGELRIEVGRVKTADRAAVAEIAGNKNAVQGGRESEAAGRKADALSDSLRRSLLGHRNLAAQIVTAEKPEAAKLLLACWTVLHIRHSVRFSYDREDAPCNLSITAGGGTRTAHPIIDDAGKLCGETFKEQIAKAIAHLPKSEGQLWDKLATMTGSELDAIIAYGVALSVSLQSEIKGLTAKFLAAIDLDMAWHFNATAENYLGKVSKPLIVAALTEAGKVNGKADADALAAMKKGALATEAESRLKGSGWVPALIRTPKAKKPAEPKPAKPAAPAKKKPAAKTAAVKAVVPKAKAAA